MNTWRSRWKLFCSVAWKECDFEWKTPSRFDGFWDMFFSSKTMLMQMIQFIRCSSFKINDFVRNAAVGMPIWRVWAPETNGLRRGWYFQNIWWWFWQYVYRGARIKNQNLLERLHIKMQFWMKNIESFWCFLRCIFSSKTMLLEMVKSTRCFSCKINDFASIGAMRIPIWCVWAPKTNGLRRGWYFQKNWKWFWQCVYRGARIKIHHCCEELCPKVQFWLKNTESFWCFLKCVFLIKTLRLEIVKSTRCFSCKINDFVSIGAMGTSILSVWALKTNGLRRGWYFQKKWKWFWQCVYRGARIKIHHCCEELCQKS